MPRKWQRPPGTHMILYDEKTGPQTVVIRKTGSKYLYVAANMEAKEPAWMKFDKRTFEYAGEYYRQGSPYRLFETLSQCEATLRAETHGKEIDAFFRTHKTIKAMRQRHIEELYEWMVEKEYLKKQTADGES